MPHTSVTNSSPPLLCQWNFKYLGKGAQKIAFLCRFTSYNIVQQSQNRFLPLIFLFLLRLILTYLGQAKFRTKRTAALRADPLNDQWSDFKKIYKKWTKKAVRVLQTSDILVNPCGPPRSFNQCRRSPRMWWSWVSRGCSVTGGMSV